MRKMVVESQLPSRLMTREPNKEEGIMLEIYLNNQNKKNNRKEKEKTIRLDIEFMWYNQGLYMFLK